MRKEFFDFIIERQNIWHKRFILKQSPPWTNDKTLQTFKIINVFRELDKGTEYIINKLSGKDRKTILLNLYFYRFFNQFNLYEILEISPFKVLDKSLLRSKFETLEKNGKRIFNNAYLISGKKDEKKYLSVLDVLDKVSTDIDSIVEKLDIAKTPEESFEALQSFEMVGPFLAYEIWTDLTYFNFFNQGWTDDDFVNVGPGALWGLKIIFGELTKKHTLEKLIYLRDIQKNYLGENQLWKKISYKKGTCYPFLSLRNIEHSLCEFRKYYNLSRGVGRRKYYSLNSAPQHS